MKAVQAINFNYSCHLVVVKSTAHNARLFQGLQYYSFFSFQSFYFIFFVFLNEEAHCLMSSFNKAITTTRRGVFYIIICNLLLL